MSKSVAVNALLEKLAEDRSLAVSDAGAAMLQVLTEGRLAVAAFLEDPLVLVGPPYFVSRYVAQVVLRAMQGDYETLEDVSHNLYPLLGRSTPTLERGRAETAERVVVAEARVLDIRHPARKDAGYWESGVVALVTSGVHSGAEIDLVLRSDVSRTPCFLVPYLWIHATIAAYNLVPDGENRFAGCAETFLVIEPMRQINATSVARSLHCSKPQLDQIRKGKGDVTIHTLKGTIIHALFDRLLEKETDLAKIYEEVIPRHIVQLAALVDEFFDEAAFRSEIFRHLAALRSFIDSNPQLLEDTQLELKRYSATIGIQGRIDAVFRQENRVDILELKTGARIRSEDHAQLFIYRLLLSDMVRRSQRGSGEGIGITARLLSSTDGGFAPLRIHTDFHQVLDARNKLLVTQYALGRQLSHFKFRYEGFNSEVCGNCPSWTRKRCKQTSSEFGDRPGSLEPAELEYFRRFTRLVQQERWYVDQQLADLLDDSRIELRARNFRTLVGVRIVADGEPFTFEFSRNTSDLEAGDSVLIHQGNISSTATFHGYVRRVETGRIAISIPLKNISTAAFADGEWIVDRFPSDMTAEASHTALYDFLVSPDGPRKTAILGNGPARPGNGLLRIARPRVPQAAIEPGSFNASQIKAIESAVSCAAYHLVWGPPGTGKTKVIPEIVRRVEGGILVGAFTNTAVDKMLIALLAEDPSTRFLRMGRAADSPELAACLQHPEEYFSEDLALKYRDIRAVRERMDSVRIVAATAHRTCSHPYLRGRAFEMVIVDEAGQLTEPLTLGLILRGRRFVLIGDDKQLPPVVHVRGLAPSMFERLRREAERTHARTLTLLDTQYRMHPQIMAVSNRLFYEGRLRSGVSHEDRLPPDGNPVLLVPVEGVPGDRRNESEARVVVSLVRRYLDVYGVMPASIGVVSPFRAQVVLLRQLLDGTGVTVDTVERFQGGERDIMILSFVRHHGSDFVFDERRFNVAITRARRKLVLVAHPGLFLNSRYEWICTFTETPRTAGTT